MKKGVVAVLLGLLMISTPVHAQELMKGHATVYSLEGKTVMGTPVRFGVCASGNRALLGKLVAVYQRLPDDSVGGLIGIYSVEDTGCKANVIDIWCPKEYQKLIINKTWENGCKGRIYIQTIEMKGENE